MTREAWSWTRALVGFIDPTRWMKDTAGTVRGILAVALAVAAVIGTIRIVDRILPRRQAQPLEIQSNSGHIETQPDKRQTKVGINLF